MLIMKHADISWNCCQRTHNVPCAKPTIEKELLLWPDEEESDEEDKSQQLFMIEQSLPGKEQIEDEMINQLLVN